MVRIVLMGGRCTDLMILMQTKGNIYMLMQKERCAGPMLKAGKMGYIGPMLKEGKMGCTDHHAKGGQDGVHRPHAK